MKKDQRQLLQNDIIVAIPRPDQFDLQKLNAFIAGLESMEEQEGEREGSDDDGR